MSGRIRDADVRAVRERSPLEEIVGEHLLLAPAGSGELKGLCPFHDEKSPSFHVTPARGYYYCFGCGEGGDVITFVQKVEHLSFAEAVERLARRAGFPLTYEQGGAAPGRQQGLRTRLFEAHAAAAEFYAAQLLTPAAAPAREFLADRGFAGEIVNIFGCGYAPAGWTTLLDHLTKYGFTRDELITGGLAKMSQRGSPIDAFRGRLVWPIRDLTGAVVAFNARRVSDDDPLAKYVNSAETPIFVKGSVLYGADLAKRDIARTRQCVVVEGVTDVMACHAAGVTTAVATFGTSFAAEHIRVIRRLLMDQDEFRGEVIFLFDGDAAGQKAALRAFAEDQAFVAQTYVAIEPGGLDPCDLRGRQGDLAVRDLVGSRTPLFEFAIRTSIASYDLEHPEGRVAALNSAVPVLARIRDRSLRPEYARRVAGWLGLDVDEVLTRVSESTGEPRGNHGRQHLSAPQRSRREARAVDPAATVEREALKIAVQRPVLAGPMFDSIEPAAFRDPSHRVLASLIHDLGGAAAQDGGHGWVTSLRDAASDDIVRSLVTALAVDPLRPGDSSEDRYAGGVLARLREISITRRLQEIKAKVQRTDPLTDPGYDRMVGELFSLEQQRRVLREQAIHGL